MVQVFAQPSLPAVQAALTSAIQQRWGSAGAASVTKGFQDMAASVGSDWPQISAAIGRDLGKIAGEAANYVAGNRAKLMQTKGKFEPIIYLPTGPGSYVKDTLVSFKKFHIGASPTGGRLFGLGYMTGVGKKMEDRTVPIVRIDYWDMRTPLEGRPTPTFLHIHYHLGDEKNHHPPGRTIWP